MIPSIRSWMVAVRRYDCVVALAIAAGVSAAGDTRDDGAVSPRRAVGAPGSGEQLTSPRTAPVIKPEDRMAQFPSVPLRSRLQQIDASKQALPNEAIRHGTGMPKSQPAQGDCSPIQRHRA